MERRTHPREQVSHPVLYISDIYPKTMATLTIDLSVGGTRIETSYTLMKGERLQISIAIHPQVIKCRGQVVHVLWVNGHTSMAGVRFEEMSKQDGLYLREYISYLMEQRDSMSP
jgi:hypothetical protein